MQDERVTNRQARMAMLYAPESTTEVAMFAPERTVVNRTAVRRNTPTIGPCFFTVDACTAAPKRQTIDMMAWNIIMPFACSPAPVRSLYVPLDRKERTMAAIHDKTWTPMMIMFPGETTVTSYVASGFGRMPALVGVGLYEGRVDGMVFVFPMTYPVEHMLMVVSEYVCRWVGAQHPERSPPVGALTFAQRLRGQINLPVK
jgi:hypothetical protein